MIRVLLVDDHPIVRAGLIAVLETDPDLVVVGQASSGPEALVEVERTDPDVVLMDLRMPGGDGTEAMRAMCATGRARPRVLVLTTYDSPRDVRGALSAGAHGFLLKDTPRAELIDAVRRVAEGSAVLTQEQLRALSGADEGAHLTPRERDVLREIARGGTNREASARLFISETTLKTHLARCFDKLGVSDRAAAVHRAYDLGIL